MEEIIKLLEDMQKRQEDSKMTLLKQIETFSGYELVSFAQNKLTEFATGGTFDDDVYKMVRKKLLQDKSYTVYLPSWLQSNRDISQFWNFIKKKFSTYAERRTFLKNEFSNLLDILEFQTFAPIEATIVFDEKHIHEQWMKAIERKNSDPEGAITMARTLIESVLKHLLTEMKIHYTETMDISELYKEVAKSLNLAPEQHQEAIFKQILGGANGIISGLGTLRNKLGDAHGGNKAKVKPSERHSELAVNISGTMAIFLYKTFLEQKAKS